MSDKPALQIDDAVIVKDGARQDKPIAPLCAGQFEGEVVFVWADGTVDVQDQDGNVFDSIEEGDVDLVCPECGEPMGVYMKDGGTSLEEVYGCKSCDL